MTLDESSEPPSSQQTSPTLTTHQVSAGREKYVYRHALRAVITAMGFNFIIAALKMATAVATRSTALFSEGMHSLADALNSITLLVGILQGKKAPDRSHPFGYGLETNLWALFASFLLLVSSIWAIYTGVQRLLHPESLEDPFWAIVILLVSMVFEVFAIHTASRAVLEEVGEDATWLGTIPKAFRNIRHVVGPTTRFVFYEDTLAFLGAAVALIALMGGEFLVHHGLLAEQYGHVPDAVASIIIGILLLILAINLFRYNREVLTGSSAPLKVENRIKELVLAIHGVTEVHDLKTISHGLSGLFVHMKVEVDPATQVRDVDDLIERIKNRLIQRIPNVMEVFIEVLADESKEEWGVRFIQLVEEGAQEEVLKSREVVMLRNLYEFTDTVVSDIMVPRPDIEAVSAEQSLEDVANLVFSSGHSRFPVYMEKLDDVVGLIHARDVFQCLHEGRMDTPVTDIMTDIKIYPENKSVSDLLEEFKRHRIQIAVVADEHGGLSGIVTIEDLLEEIVGEIWDESDVEERMITQVSTNRLLVLGKCEIYELNSRYDLNIPENEFVTIGGFIFGLLGEEPEEGDTATFEELLFTVKSVEGHRISTLIIDGHEPFQEKENAEEELALRHRRREEQSEVITLFPGQPEEQESDNDSPKRSEDSRRNG